MDHRAPKEASAMPVHYHCHLDLRVCREVWRRTLCEAAGNDERKSGDAGRSGVDAQLVYETCVLAAAQRLWCTLGGRPSSCHL